MKRTMTLKPPDASYVPIKVKEDPKFKKYFKLLRMNMPIEQIQMKMEVDGVDPNLLNAPDAVSPNDPGVRPEFRRLISISLTRNAHGARCLRDQRRLCLCR